ncbi:PEP/pyruvate-binding domain-containing protein [Dyadobacter jiangsuensis]|uniref:Pyruvate,water dikinase n=1 Tax=Dyadobacter jiangsuensis TaxID=1591085 RepID=A0A2P8GBF3_9BACT|nr:PEP/pyruvate-binding domain-containing protein [Dyadobacter jiangsuensis]PSL31298.1 pyruvate,water dikinase [Dyadobacter jiangsuensis]
MHFISDTEPHKTTGVTIGGKAGNLFRLKQLGLPVPHFVVIPWETLRADISGPELVTGLLSAFEGTRYFAVRSSAAGEDGAAFSFAGQFESYLGVTPDELAARIADVRQSAFSKRVMAYRKHHGLSDAGGVAVIVQEMVDADAAGVAFGANPLTGNRQQKVINAVPGLGDRLVSGEVNADEFLLEGAEIQSNLADGKQAGPALTNEQIYRLGQILESLEKELGHPQDIEFAVRNDQIFLLQTRPITTLKAKPEGNYILWDNSNIIESYPGVTTPLTFSFISKSYETAYKLFSAYLGVSELVIKKNERVFANTLGFLNGRVYYNLKTWYHMLAMLPGYSINARYMEKMMGVKEQFDIPDSYRLPKGKAWWSILKMAVQMLFRFRALPGKRREFMQLVEGTINEYKAIPFAEKSADELMHLYLNFERKLLLEWKAPLLNDFFAMIWFGMLQKQCGQLSGSANPNLHNDLLCGSNDIISVQPVHRSIAIAARIAAVPALKDLFMTKNEQAIHEMLSLSNDPEFVGLRADIDRYIADFGERCVGELKLETISYGQEPARFIKVLKSYVETGITNAQFSGEREGMIRTNAQREIATHLKGKTIGRLKMRLTLHYTRELVSARENLRYERTRAFGIVREIFTFIGKRFYADGLLTNARDVFYLTKEEIFSQIEGTAVTQDVKALVALRQKAFQGYRELGPLSERFATYGVPYNGNDFFNIDRVEMPEGDLKGIGCSPGRVTGRVRVVADPAEVPSLNGDILVTTSTDPGWVTLFPGASGIIVERGSLLSHSAIVSREMGKPCIVGVTGLLKSLKTGDEIEMDGSTGIIRTISR